MNLGTLFPTVGTLLLTALPAGGPGAAAAAAAAGSADDALAFDRVSVTVTITRVSNVRRHCGTPIPFDPRPFGCSRPDYFAIIRFDDGRTRIHEWVSPIQRNRDTFSPGWTHRHTMGHPGTIQISLWDDDSVPGVPRVEPADLGPGAGADTIVLFTESRVGAGIQTFQASGGDTEITGTIRVDPVRARLERVSLSGTSIDPERGETVRIRSGTSHAARVTLRVRNPTTNAVVYESERLHEPEPGRGLEFAWNGLDGAGAPVETGEYRVELAGRGIDAATAALGTDPAAVAAKVEVVERGFTTLGIFVAPEPFGTGVPLEIPFSIPMEADSGAVEAWVSRGDCGAFESLGALPEANTKGGIDTLRWSGFLPDVAVAGPFAVRMRAHLFHFVDHGTRVDTVRWVTGSECVEALAVPPSRTLLVAIEHEPTLLAPDTSAAVTAHAVNGEGWPRRAGVIEVWIAEPFTPGSQPGGVVAVPPGAPSEPSAVCRSAERCTAQIELPAEAPAWLSYRARAHDVGIGDTTDTGWRTTQVFTPGLIGRDRPLALSVASVAPYLPQPRNRTLEIVWSPSTNFGLRSGTRRAQLSGELRRYLRALWGIRPVWRTNSALLANQDHINVHLGLRMSAVGLPPERRLLGPFRPCEFSLPLIPFAEAHGAIHREPCRDNAPRGMQTFSANWPAIMWHELHHALFGLADEYCCHGGYHQDIALPNVFRSQAECRQVEGRPAGGCQPIAECLTVSIGVVGGKIDPEDPLDEGPPELDDPGELEGERKEICFEYAAFPGGGEVYRLDADPNDVMDNNTFQRFGDLRQVLRKLNRCDAGRC